MPDFARIQTTEDSQLTSPLAADNRIKHYAWLLAVVFMALLIFTTALYADHETNQWFIKENGLIESMSAAGYILCVIIMIKLGRDAWLKQMWYLPVMLLAFAMRELDLHNRYTGYSILSSNFLLKPEVTLAVKAIGVSVVLFIFFAAWRMLRQHLPGILQRFWQRRLTPVDWGVGLGTAFMIVAKSIDGLGRKLAGLGITISEHTDSVAAHLEESLEWAIPFLFTVAVLSYFSQRKTGTQSG